jgi:hypothetical protein
MARELIIAINQVQTIVQGNTNSFVLFAEPLNVAC